VTIGHGNARAVEACTAASARQVAPVVELYTSEGCNSCPPADRWLSKLKADPAVVALAFHVDYWDRLGWKDRFASAAFHCAPGVAAGEQRRRFSYTPQVVVDGREPHRLVAGDGVDADPPGRGGRRRGRAPGRPLRRHRHAGGRRAATSRRVLGSHRAKATSPPSRR
jgi:hypothetical protein